MRSILVPMTEAEGQTAVIANALTLTRKFNAHLTGLFVRPDPRAAIPFMGEGLTADAIQDLCDAADRESRNRADATEDMFRTAVEKAGLSLGGDPGNPPSAAWTQVIGLIAEKVGRHARLADLTVVPQPVEAHSRDAADLLNEVLFRSGRPLLMSPPESRPTIGETVVIGWNGRAECARTVASSLPFLKTAKAVHVVTVGDDHPDRPGLGAVQDYLGLHGVTVSTDRIAPSDQSVNEILASRVAELKADMLVIGAYSHSRWREMIIGGATRDAIDSSSVPVFMGH